MRLIKIFILTFILTGEVTSCTDRQESHFDTYYDLIESGYFKRGWIPRAIPNDSKDIQEIHDLDNNRVFGRFEFDPAVVFDSLNRIPIEEVITVINSINSPSRPVWFPADKELRQMQSNKSEDFIVIYNSISGNGYFVR